MNRARQSFEDRLDFFPYGVQYHRAPTPLPTEWEGDLAEIARVGYTHIQLRPQWRWHERVQGHRTWDDLDRLFDLAKANNLRVVLKPMLETAPDWVFSELGGTRIGFHGVPISPVAHGAYYVGGWWPCFDNPQVVETASSFVGELISRYKTHPALWFYDAWNEPMSRPIGQCQCGHSIAAYRQWLRERYTSIEDLNAAFGKAWTSFETLLPPSAAADYAEMFLWRQWACDSVAKQVRFVSQKIRACDPEAFVLVHSANLAVMQDPIGISGDDLLNARETDRFGTSFGIPQHPETPLEHDSSDYQSDWVRRVDPKYWCHEFYPNRADWCVPTSPETLQLQIWMAIAGGTAGFTFWQYRSERVGCESNGFGLREIDGSPTPRSEAADRVAAVLAGPGRTLVGTRRVRSRIAILHSRESDMIARIQAVKPWMNDIALEMPTDRYFYKDAIKGTHALHAMAGNTVEWVVPGDSLGEVDFLHVTACEIIPEDTAAWLAEFVESGGTLLVEFPFACRDSNTWVSLTRPSCGLDALIGCGEVSRTILQPGQHAVFRGTQVVPKGWKIVLEPMEEAEVIGYWEDGTPAGVMNSYGEGQVITLGCSISSAFADTWQDPVRDVFRSLLTEVGALENPRLPDGLWIRKRVGRDREVWFVFNVSTEQRQLEFESDWRVSEWTSSLAHCDRGVLSLRPGGCWVGEVAGTPQTIRITECEKEENSLVESQENQIFARS